ncbi:Ulp1 family isopeptidase [Mesorhizobium hawassense]|uniref:Ulp1 family isopeptidase n=1 Tax=Mesorhizobium hawassense TaxID=1209954 RepID=UPI00142E8A5E|nr:Ulp1 family isopeptidase [Mesorhizobium hawassense]
MALRKLSRWLVENHQSDVGGRLHDPELHRLAREVAGDGAKLLRQMIIALGRLQQATAVEYVTPTPISSRASSQLRAQNLNQVELPRSPNAHAGLEPSTATRQTAMRVFDRSLPDEALFTAFRSQARMDGVNKSTSKSDIVALRKFSRWLSEKHQRQIGDGIHDTELDRLAVEAAAGDKTLLWRLGSSLKRLRQADVAARVTTASRVQRLGAQGDEELFANLRKAAVGNVPKEKARIDIRVLRKFSAWLGDNHRTQINGRIEDRQLDSLAQAFAGNDTRLLWNTNAALRRARQYNSGARMASARVRNPGTKNDEELFANYNTKATASEVNAGTIWKDVAALRKLSRWLADKHGTQIADRLEDPDLDVMAKASPLPDAGRSIQALRRLRQAKAGERVTTHTPNPISDGKQLIDDAMNLAAAAEGYTKTTVKKYRSLLGGFEAKLTKAFGKSITQMEPAELSQAAAGYRKDARLEFDTAWSVFQKYQQIVAANKALGLAADGREGSRRQQGGSYEAAVPSVPTSPDWEVLRAFNQRDAASPGVPMATGAQETHEVASLPQQSALAIDAPLAAEPARESSIAPSLPLLPMSPAEQDWEVLRAVNQQEPASSRRSSEVFADLDDWLQDDARSAPPSSSSRVPPQAGSSPKSSQVFAGLEDFIELEDEAHSAPPSSSSRVPPQAGSSPKSSQVFAGLEDFIELEDEAHSALPSSSSRVPPQSSKSYGPSGIAPAASFAEMGSLAPRASRQDRSSLDLGPRDWLGDEHITADYSLLEQQLQRENPDLAARTRFVRPAQAHLLRMTDNEAVLRETFYSIVNDQDGNDTGRHLFVPLNDAHAGGGGTHWSLLLVDRRAGGDTVAYHYDSAVGGRNSIIAQELAQRLGAVLMPARMAQQQNGYDCGVFLVNGTRTLVKRLAQRQWPMEPHLDNLVPDRQALQNRLNRLERISATPDRASTSATR